MNQREGEIGRCIIYPFGAAVKGIDAELHNDLDTPERDRADHSNNGVHRHAAVNGIE